MAEAPSSRVQVAGKVYRLYQRPACRLWQLLWPRKQPWYKDFTALEDVIFEPRRGEVLGVVGVNGAGKSTRLELVTGTVRHTSGQIKTRGRIAAPPELGTRFNP